ncbi:hypothetical protein BLNAU_22227 [Blattamonas nauphoetae]|uniref:Uncharacterized protein n=1 Tax=Blattamonas nauphoetae TaxID=2049346 RepID=A0ABQ9WWR9_9EUKA|nr:hypothetical protein BLNAU_22227 [Blattamonas nauphoetae]
MFEYSFGLQTQEVVELLTFKPFELQLLFEFVDEEQYQTHSISSSILFLNHSEEIVKLCGDDSTTISFIAQILTLSITNSSDIVAEYSSAGQITFSTFPPLIQADLLSEVTSTLLKVVEKKTEEHTHKLVSTAIQSSLTLDTIPEKYESLFVLSVPLLQRSISFLLHLWTVFASLVEREPTTVSSFVSLLRFVSLLQNWQLTLTGIKSFVHIFYSLLHTKDPRLSLLFQLAAHCHPSLPLLPFSTHLQRRLANKVCGAGDVDLCVLTLSSLLTNTHVAVPSSTRNQVKAVGVLSTRKRRETRKSVSAFEEKMSETEAQNSKPAAEQDEPKEQADDDNELFQSHS